ncbi:MAG: hypothetical protein KF712_11395 [Akkermansiaceae bacterium]|nr:hypothetical protein [Akkermansiaceae bacterium]
MEYGKIPVNGITRRTGKTGITMQHLEERMGIQEPASDGRNELRKLGFRLMDGNLHAHYLAMMAKFVKSTP